MILGNLPVDVSLIITHYKQFSYLVELLEFLKENRWCEAREIIVIDDCSLKNEEQERLKACFSEPTYIFQTKNVGPSASRNKGVSIASGKYIQFLDADDWIEPEKISIQFREALKHNFPAFVCSTWARVKAESITGQPILIKTFEPDLSPPTIISIMKGFFPLMSGLILKEVFLEVNGFDENMRLIEDVNLSIRMYDSTNHFYYSKTEKPLFYYRTAVPKSLSQSNNYEFNLSLLKNYDLAYTKLEQKNIFSTEELNALRNSSFEVIWHIYLSAIEDKNSVLLNKALNEINKIRFKGTLNKHGKKYLLCRIIGFNNFAKLSLLLNRL